MAVSPTGDVYVALANNNAPPGTVSVISPDNTLLSTTIPVGTNPVGVAVSPTGDNAGEVYVTNRNPASPPGTVSVIDPTDDSVVNTIKVGMGPSWVAVAP